MLRFSIRYRVSVRFRLRFFKYPFYSRILVLLVFLYSKLKLLLSTGRYNAWSRFVEFSGISRSLVDISGNLIFVEFGRIPRLVESGGFLRYIDFGRNFRLVGPSRFSRL